MRRIIHCHKRLTLHSDFIGNNDKKQIFTKPRYVQKVQTPLWARGRHTNYKNHSRMLSTYISDKLTCSLLFLNVHATKNICLYDYITVSFPETKSIQQQPNYWAKRNANDRPFWGLKKSTGHLEWWNPNRANLTTQE